MATDFSFCHVKLAKSHRFFVMFFGKSFFRIDS
jgi:hypothetical protein